MLAHLPAEACVIVSPPQHVSYYLYLRPGLARRICAEPPRTALVVAVISPYSTSGEREQLSQLLSPSYEQGAMLQAGAGMVVDYRRRR